MNIEEVTKLTEDYYAELVRQIEQGKPEQLVAYLTAMAKFWSYSYGNVGLIVRQRPDATRVAGFRTWQKLDRFVLKGEKGIGILVPMIWKPKDQPEGEEHIIKRFKVGHVFDVSQTDGKPLPDAGIVHAKGDPADRLQTLKDAVTGSSIDLSYSENLGGALGVSKKGAIVIKAGLEPAEEFTVLVHEFAHELLHQGDQRKDRPTTKTVRETEAEAVAFVVASAIGLDCGGSSTYIQLYNGDQKTLKESLHFIQATAKHILTELGMSDKDAEDDKQPRPSLKVDVNDYGVSRGGAPVQTPRQWI